MRGVSLPEPGYHSEGDVATHLLEKVVDVRPLVDVIDGAPPAKKDFDHVPLAPSTPAARAPAPAAEPAGSGAARAGRGHRARCRVDERLIEVEDQRLWLVEGRRLADGSASGWAREEAAGVGAVERAWRGERRGGGPGGRTEERRLAQWIVQEPRARRDDDGGCRDDSLLVRRSAVGGCGWRRRREKRKGRVWGRERRPEANDDVCSGRAKSDNRRVEGLCSRVEGLRPRVREWHLAPIVSVGWRRRAG